MKLTSAVGRTYTVLSLPVLAVEGTGVMVLNRETKKEVGVIVTAWANVACDTYTEGESTFPWQQLGYMPLVYDQSTMTLRPIIELYDPIKR